MIDKLEEKGINKNKIYYLPNWIDPKNFKEKKKKEDFPIFIEKHSKCSQKLL